MALEHLQPHQPLGMWHLARAGQNLSTPQLPDNLQNSQTSFMTCFTWGKLSPRGRYGERLGQFLDICPLTPPDSFPTEVFHVSKIRDVPSLLSCLPQHRAREINKLGLEKAKQILVHCFSNTEHNELCFHVLHQSLFCFC